MKTITTIEAVIQRNPSGDTWYAGYGSQGLDDGHVFGMGCYLAETWPTRKEAKQAALELAASYRNTVLTLGGCTFETLPRIVFRTINN